MQQRGFTLIELIVVIVILGILAVTAAPRFIDVQSDARAGTLDAVKASLQSAGQLVYAKAAINNIQEDATGNVTVNGNTVPVVFGYPSGASTETEIGYLIDVSDWTVTEGSGSAATASPASGSFGISPTGTDVDFSITATTGDSCHVLYTSATAAASQPTITIVSGGC